MYQDYVKTLGNKLKKLNKGNYSGCKVISLIILSVSRALDSYDALVAQKAYKSLIKKYPQKFNNLYFITTNSIFKINEDKVFILKTFNDEFSETVIKMKQMLRIHKFSDC